jgi:hypothetical protein
MSASRQGAEGLPAEVRSHVQSCPNCQAIGQIAELPSAAVDVSPAELQRLQGMIVGRLRRVSPLPASWLFLLAFAAVFAAVAGLGAWYLKPYGWFALMPVQKMAVFASLAAGAALLAFALVQEMVPGHRALLPERLLPLGLFVLLCLLFASVFQVRVESHFAGAAQACLKAGIPFAIPAGIVFVFILRRGALLSPRTTAATAGMLAGLVSTTVLEVHCRNLDVRHILVSHVSIALLGLIVGWLIGVAGDVMRRRSV